MTALPTDTPAIFLMGATACGKTALSLVMAETLDAEIISVDSALVYRGMDIGTAKPSVAERAGIMHHLIDVCDPWQPYSAAQFCHDANALILQIHSRGKRALLVGGTMLYFKALEEGLADLPDADAAIRQVLVAQAEKQGWQALHQQLARIDPVAAARIHPNDPQRLQRALEVYEITGTPLSELQAQTHSQLAAAPAKFALIPDNRLWLHQRIEQRFQHMLEQGFMEEMQGLYHHEKIHAALPAIRSVGYRQAWEYLDADVHNGQWVDKAIAATRQLAKRQLTWLRSMSNVHAIQCDTLMLEQQMPIVLSNTAISNITLSNTSSDSRT